jgi:arylsulfatase
MPLNEYKPGTRFSGLIGRTVDQSSPAWPMPLRAKEGAPNVLFIILDDTGFGQIGCCGSPIETPNLDSLAANGLLYTNMQTTALCSPTRSCILTGRNHHANGMAGITEISTGYPATTATFPLRTVLSPKFFDKRLQHLRNRQMASHPANEISGAGPYNRGRLPAASSDTMGS